MWHIGIYNIFMKGLKVHELIESLDLNWSMFPETEVTTRELRWLEKGH